jgi:hypothetical protein
VKRVLSTAILALAALSGFAQSDTSLYGVHWWGWNPSSSFDMAPADMLDVPKNKAWTTEVVITNSAAWWQGWYFSGLYSNLDAIDVKPLTRIDYNWGETIPNPSSPDRGNWPQKIVDDVVSQLRHGSNIWILGNEANIIGEGNNWPNNQIPPKAFADEYRRVRNHIRAVAPPSPHGNHLLLIGGPSPGGVIPGIRWMDGNDYLSQVIDNIPKDEIDGFALHAYGFNSTGFMNGLIPQLELLKDKGLDDKPVWITEWNRQVFNSNDEATAANMVRETFDKVHAWNQQIGNVNVVGLNWFVYDYDNQAGGGWQEFAIEYWKNNGYPQGDSRDLYTAYQDAAQKNYPAGVWGVRYGLGDANGDNRVGSADFLALVSSYGSEPGDDNWDAKADFNYDLRVGSQDFLLLVQNYGKKY